MPRRRSEPLRLALVLALVPALPAVARDRVPVDAFAAARPADPQPLPANGAIFQGGYTPLTSGGRAGRVGDVLTIRLIERTIATKSNSAGIQRGGDIGLTPPATGPLSLFNPSDVAMGGEQQFEGQGEAAQANSLNGEITVTVAEVYANGTMLVKGQKLVTLNRGDEWVQISGIVRAIDIDADNRVASTRVADAHIRYTGKGEIARASRQGWLQRFFSILSPF